ncbi:M12 family metallopeptidase [Rhizobium leguminosarum]|uniref:M12 family metallopeptidase n=1 Tax=Rhizobium leguminosarum TaxID=384 RepID=UPI0014428C0A|nr:M12 family metallopeptidase [Rhizobium leguminosarum]MBY5868469.1 hypothetical protein [Rhizobium leguminosarum]
MLKMFAFFCMALIATPLLAATLTEEGAKLAIPPDGPGVRRLSDRFVSVGDIIITDDTVGPLAAVIRLWPNGILIYDFDASVTPTQQATLIQACADWTTGTPVTCRRRTSERNFVLVRTHTGDGCGAVTSCSSVGMVGNQQPFNVLEGHWSSIEVIEHELGHAFGLIHEHNRPDRDAYIFVHANNVRDDYKHDVLDSYPAKAVTDYDYLSIMHYSNCGGTVHGGCNDSTRNLWTLEPKPCGLDKVGGHVISDLDRQGIKVAYSAALVTAVGIERSAACGQLSYGRENVPVGAQATDVFLKVETVNKDDCGSFVPSGWGDNLCVPLKKTEISKTGIDADPFSCGFLSLATSFHASATCGCPISNFWAMCSAEVENKLPAYKSATDAGSWKMGRVQYFNEIMRGLKDEDMIDDDVWSGVQDFYFLNFADGRLESKLFNMRHRLFSYARWKKSVDQNFRVDGPMFQRFATRQKLRVGG